MLAYEHPHAGRHSPPRAAAANSGRPASAPNDPY